ncbi:MAG: hypothetical protein GOV00_01350 [Candidatus Altiarchaeota archaeon]|nr:hypothetical protein [Candidatus Altiarchaeota archaeon]
MAGREKALIKAVVFICIIGAMMGVWMLSFTDLPTYWGLSLSIVSALAMFASVFWTRRSITKGAAVESADLGSLFGAKFIGVFFGLILIGGIVLSVIAPFLSLYLQGGELTGQSIELIDPQSESVETFVKWFLPQILADQPTITITLLQRPLAMTTALVWTALGLPATDFGGGDITMLAMMLGLGVSLALLWFVLMPMASYGGANWAAVKKKKLDKKLWNIMGREMGSGDRDLGKDFSYANLNITSAATIWRSFLLVFTKLKKISHTIEALVVRGANVEEGKTLSKADEERLDGAVLEFKKLRKNIESNYTSSVLYTGIDYFVWGLQIVFMSVTLGIIGLIVGGLTGQYYASILPFILAVSVWFWRSIQMLGRRLVPLVMSMAPPIIQTMYLSIFFPEEVSLTSIGILAFGVLGTFLVSFVISAGVSGATVIAVIIALIATLVGLVILANYAKNSFGNVLMFFLLTRAFASIFDPASSLSGSPLELAAGFFMVTLIFVAIFDLLVHIYLMFSFSIGIFMSKTFSGLGNIIKEFEAGMGDLMDATGGKSTKEVRKKLVEHARKIRDETGKFIDNVEEDAFSNILTSEIDGKAVVLSKSMADKLLSPEKMKNLNTKLSNTVRSIEGTDYHMITKKDGTYLVEATGDTINNYLGKFRSLKEAIQHAGQDAAGIGKKPKKYTKNDIKKVGKIGDSGAGTIGGDFSSDYTVKKAINASIRTKINEITTNPFGKTSSGIVKFGTGRGNRTWFKKEKNGSFTLFNRNGKVSMRGLDKNAARMLHHLDKHGGRMDYRGKSITISRGALSNKKLVKKIRDELGGRKRWGRRGPMRKGPVKITAGSDTMEVNIKRDKARRDDGLSFKHAGGDFTVGKDTKDFSVIGTASQDLKDVLEVGGVDPSDGEQRKTAQILKDYLATGDKFTLEAEDPRVKSSVEFKEVNGRVEATMFDERGARTVKTSNSIMESVMGARVFLNKGVQEEALSRGVTVKGDEWKMKTKFGSEIESEIALSDATSASDVRSAMGGREVDGFASSGTFFRQGELVTFAPSNSSEVTNILTPLEVVLHNQDSDGKIRSEIEKKLNEGGKLRTILTEDGRQRIYVENEFGTETHRLILDKERTTLNEITFGVSADGQPVENHRIIAARDLGGGQVFKYEEKGTDRSQVLNALQTQVANDAKRVGASEVIESMAENLQTTIKEFGKASTVRGTEEYFELDIDDTGKYQVYKWNGTIMEPHDIPNAAALDELVQSNAKIRLKDRVEGTRQIELEKIGDSVYYREGGRTYRLGDTDAARTSMFKLIEDIQDNTSELDVRTRKFKDGTGGEVPDTVSIGEMAMLKINSMPKGKMVIGGLGGDKSLRLKRDAAAGKIYVVDQEGRRGEYNMADPQQQAALAGYIDRFAREGKDKLARETAEKADMKATAAGATAQIAEIKSDKAQAAANAAGGMARGAKIIGTEAYKRAEKADVRAMVAGGKAGKAQKTANIAETKADVLTDVAKNHEVRIGGTERGLEHEGNMRRRTEKQVIENIKGIDALGDDAVDADKKSYEIDRDLQNFKEDYTNEIVEHGTVGQTNKEHIDNLQESVIESHGQAINAIVEADRARRAAGGAQETADTAIQEVGEERKTRHKQTTEIGRGLKNEKKVRHRQTSHLYRKLKGQKGTGEDQGKGEGGPGPRPKPDEPTPPPGRGRPLQQPEVPEESGRVQKVVPSKVDEKMQRHIDGRIARNEPNEPVESGRAFKEGKFVKSAVKFAEKREHGKISDLTGRPVQANLVQKGGTNEQQMFPYTSQLVQRSISSERGAEEAEGELKALFGGANKRQRGFFMDSLRKLENTEVNRSGEISTLIGKLSGASRPRSKDVEHVGEIKELKKEIDQNKLDSMNRSLAHVSSQIDTGNEIVQLKRDLKSGAPGSSGAKPTPHIVGFGPSDKDKTIAAELIENRGDENFAINTFKKMEPKKVNKALLTLDRTILEGKENKKDAEKALLKIINNTHTRSEDNRKAGVTKFLIEDPNTFERIANRKYDQDVITLLPQDRQDKLIDFLTHERDKLIRNEQDSKYVRFLIGELRQLINERKK